MKKVLFSMLAALFMGAVFTACSDKKAEKGSDGESTEVVAEEADEDEFEFDASGSPAEQLVSLTKLFVGIMKSAHINSEADAEALKGKVTKIQAKMEEVQKSLESSMESMSDAEKLKMATEMLTVAAEFEGIEKEMQTVVDRLQKEAAAAGVNIDDLDLD